MEICKNFQKEDGNTNKNDEENNGLKERKWKIDKEMLGATNEFRCGLTFFWLHMRFCS